ncbi:DHA2 family efflux MFS transporter permease subunit [Acidipila sp. EB88]|uniref:DHA2 family efflux MFS transporter permease subunit n=1 Tax=Acidipila sp. EB88 TaxID=2305226 RepID=UPI000F5E577E|nr:DHA2 family efflux MFS transporter permease subunit [Acidipila sp. EB88]RRA49259.1 DHA2 family efflux MFS transporter permease subunit [Acidipila sp. EB88]
MSALLGRDSSLPTANPWLIATAVMLATFMEILDTAIASVALPYIAGSLSASNDEATWVLTSYLVANAVILPASNWFARRFGRKRFLVTCVAVFTLASFLCGSAPTLAFLLLARITQGASGGALQPLSQAILLESFPPAKRGLAMALFGLGVVVAPVVGPTLGGWLTDTYSWRYAFYINLPVGALALFMIARYVQDPPHIKNAIAGRFDGLGFGLLTVWTGCLQVVLDKGQEDGWFGAVWLRWALLALTVALILFIVHCLHNRNALVDLRILQNRNFVVGSLLIFSFGIALYSLITTLPLFFQELLGYTAFDAGVAVFPRGLGAIIALPIITYLGARLDTRYLLTFGLLLFGTLALYFGNITLDVGPTTLLIPIIATGFAFSFCFVPINTASYGTLRPEEIGNASGLYNLIRNIGGSIGISLAQTLLIRRSALHQNEIVNSVPQTSDPFQQRLIALEQYLALHVRSENSSQAALGQLYLQLGHQALLWSFIDFFRYLAILLFACIALVWCFQKVKGNPPSGAH